MRRSLDATWIAGMLALLTALGACAQPAPAATQIDTPTPTAAAARAAPLTPTRTPTPTATAARAPTLIPTGTPAPTAIAGPPPTGVPARNHGALRHRGTRPHPSPYQDAHGHGRTHAHACPYRDPNTHGHGRTHTCTDQHARAPSSKQPGLPRRRPDTPALLVRRPEYLTPSSLEQPATRHADLCLDNG